MTAVWIVVPLMAYLSCFAGVSRSWYRHIRPYTEPMCGKIHVHDYQCYRRPGWAVDSADEAALYAALMGLIGPAVIIGWLIRRFVLAGDRPLTEEMAVKTRRLEKELEK